MVRWVWITFAALLVFGQGDESFVTADLKADHAVIAKGEPFELGIHLRMADHWHTYWENPGFTGLPTTWALAEVPGLTVESLVFPKPKRFVDDAGFITYGYDDEALLIAKAVYTGDAESIKLQAQIDWLECKQLCKPGSDEAVLELPVGQAKLANTALFDRFRAQIPQSYDSESASFDYRTSYVFDEEAWQGTLTITPKDSEGWPSSAEGFDLFPTGNEFAELKKINKKYSQGSYVFSLNYEAFDTPPDDLQLQAVLAVPSPAGERVTRVTLYPEQKPSTGALTPAKELRFDSTFWYYILLGFIGGIILNLMPCVLPVLSLKVFSLFKEAGDNQWSRVKLAWVYAVGIMASFLVLSGILAASTLTGERLGVGFQYQNPGFVIFVSALIFVMGLSFMGVFPIGALNSDWLSKKSQKGGVAGAFYQGALMTVLSTPCTAPLLGAAYGWSMEQPPLVILLVFQAVAVGLAFPYVLLCHVPALLKYLPKPGPWMEQFKVVMGFLLMGTVIWLFYVMAGLTGAGGVVGLMTLLLGLGLAAWIYGQSIHSDRPSRGYITAFLVSTFSLVLGLFVLFDIREPFAGKEAAQQEQRLKLIAEFGDAAPEELQRELREASTTAEKIAWIPFSDDLLAEYRAEGRMIFVDFTADWCATCKVNEALVIDTKAIRQAFVDHSVVTLKADYTHYDKRLTEILQSFQRAGVPMYVIYPGQGEPILLPETITKNIVLNGLTRAAANQTQRSER